MIRITRALRRLADDLDAEGARWAVVGGMAVSVRAEARLTRDVDVAVAVGDDAEAERLVHALLRRGYETLATLEQQTTHRLATVRLRVRGEAATGVVLDLLFATSGIEPEIVTAATPINVTADLRVPTATTAHLIAMKVLALDDEHRPNDRADALALLRIASPEDVDAARAALELMTARGFDRGKDLGELLSSLLGAP